MREYFADTPHFFYEFKLQLNRDAKKETYAKMLNQADVISAAVYREKRGYLYYKKWRSALMRQIRKIDMPPSERKEKTVWEKLRAIKG